MYKGEFTPVFEFTDVGPVTKRCTKLTSPGTVIYL